jgi:very-short-patch-repair endonuclease/predicted transcriptional regulator of viral defense system
MHARERAIAEVAGGQDNVITAEQLLALGVGRGAIAHRLGSGRWQRLHKGVYLVGPAPPTPRAAARAAVLSCGVRTLISHRTSGVLWAMLPSASDSARRLHVTVVGRNPRPRRGVQIHRVVCLAPADVTTKAGLPITSPARTICDIAGTEDLRDTEHALGEARIHGLVSDRKLYAAIERAPNRSGSAIIRALLGAEQESGYTRSRAEREMLKLARAAGLPRPSLNEPLLGYVADFLWPRQQLVVEVDGYKYHRHRAAFESDRKRDQVLVSAGYRVLRVTWLQMRDEPLFVVARVAQALAQH